MFDPQLVTAVMLYMVLLLSVVVHEAAHALFALWGGDRTAYTGGQVTLNPIPHIQREPFGTVILPILLLVISGSSWIMGYASTPIDRAWAYQNPRRAALMSAAGPLSNLLLAAIAFTILKVLILNGYAAEDYNATSMFTIIAPVDSADSGAMAALCKITCCFLGLNLILAIFNLIPLPPLDGSGILAGLFPRTVGRFIDALESQPYLMMMGLIAVLYSFQGIFRPIYWAVVDLL